ncbi:MAG: Abi family protein [Tepidisphaeraceae bacterium]
MRYTKGPLTTDQHIDQLLARGMTGDRAFMKARLEVVSYYRLSGYWYPFRKPHPNEPGKKLDEFRPGTTFEAVWNLYVFDRELRLLVMDAIERIEVAVRSKLAGLHATSYGPFAYALDSRSMPGLDAKEWKAHVANIIRDSLRSKDTFVKHFKYKYGDTHQHLPVWMAVEIMSFGGVLTCFRGASRPIKKALSDAFDMPHRVFSTWLLTLNTVRNICAHHGRLWNREIRTAPMIPLKSNYPDWHQTSPFPPGRVFAMLTICQWSLQRIAPQSLWADRVISHLRAYPAVPTGAMGFPADWKNSPIWFVKT